MNRYECYSYHLMRFLLKHNQIVLKVDIHNKTKKTFWVFEMSEELGSLLTQWTNRDRSVAVR